MSGCLFSVTNCVLTEFLLADRRCLGFGLGFGFIRSAVRFHFGNFVVGFGAGDFLFGAGLLAGFFRVSLGHGLGFLGVGLGIGFGFFSLGFGDRHTGRCGC